MHNHRPAFLALLSRLGLTTSNTIPATPVIDLDFCGADDHLLIGIGGNRFGVYSDLYFIPGVFAKLELWASEDDAASMIDAAINGQSVGSGVCLEVVTYGDLGDELVVQMRNSPQFAQSVKHAILAKLRVFRDSAYVRFQCSYWKTVRTGSPPSLTSYEELDDEYENGGWYVIRQSW